MDKQEIAKKILEDVGGSKNVKNVTHCATRLRFTLADSSLVKEDEIKNEESVMGIMKAGGQFQIIIGSDVSSYFSFIKEMLGDVKDSSENESPENNEKQGIMNKVLDYISGTMAPIIPPLVGCSLLRGVLTILVSAGLLSDKSSTYAIWYAATNAIYYFLPMIASFSAAIKLKVSPYIAVCITGALLTPQFTALFTETGNVVKFLGMPVMMFDYASSLFPALIAVWLYSYAEKWLNKVIMDSLKVVLVPLIGVAVFVPLTAMIFGPMAYYLAQGFATVFDAIYAFSPVLSGALVGGSFSFLVIFGIHWAIVPMVLNELAIYGVSKLFGVWWFANMSQWTVPAGILISTKDKKERTVAASNLISCLISGITEPVMFGYVLRNKKFAVPIAVSGAVTGALGGLFGVKVFTFTIPSILAIPTITTDGGTVLFIGLVIVEFIIGMLITKFYVYKKAKAPTLETN